jgi:glycosyltransferase involved in cell wall biosynthesis
MNWGAPLLKQRGVLLPFSIHKPIYIRQNQIRNYMKVLYVIGKFTDTSIPLEIAQNIENARIELNVLGYYEADYSTVGSHFFTEQVESQGHFDLGAVYRLYKCINTYNPDVVHVHHTVSGFWASVFSKTIDAKLVRTEHNNANFRSKSQRLVNLISRLISDFIIYNSINTFRSTPKVHKTILGNRSEVIYNGVDVARIDQADKKCPPFESQYEGITVGSVGRLIEQKNYSRLLEAFDLLRHSSEREIRLVIVGNGNERDVIETKINRLGLGQHVVLTGEVDRDEVYAALHSFDLFVVPSLWEGFCNAAVEAMTVALPIVCSDIPTLQEVVGDVAIYADPERPESFAHAIGTLLKEGEGGWKERGEKARSRALEKYSIERTAKDYVESYLQVVDSERKN